MTQKKPLLLIDPGHGGSDPGAVNTALGVEEARLNLKVGRFLHDILSANYSYPVAMTRVTNSTISLEDRVKRQKDLRAKLFVSLHFNSAPQVAQGYEVWTYPNSARARQLADNCLEFLKEAMPHEPDRGVRQSSGLYVLKNTSCPAILVEFGFLNHYTFTKWAMKTDSQNDLAWAVARAVIKTVYYKNNG